MSRSVVVLGGGPGGAFAARLIRLAQPTWTVSLCEEHPPADTFGFGVGLSISTQRNLGQSDPETFEQIYRASQRGHGMRLHAASGSVRVPNGDSMAIARSQLLQILYRQAEQAGVRVHVGPRVKAFDVDADVVIAADGLTSTTRGEQAERFGASVEVGRQRYIWCGVDVALPDALFAPVHTEHGTFTTHAYPYSADRSTFLVETDEATWRAAGFEHTSDGLRPGESDQPSLAYLQAAFQDQLGGGRLLGNHSRWAQFRTVRCGRWHDDNVVLLGDAAHTAHYSIGSGTKLAMEDAIVLAQALTEDDQVQDAFASYQQTRQPAVARVQQVAGRSQLWWEAYVSRLAMPPEQLLVSFLTRAGNVPLQAFRAREPAIADQALRQYSTPSGANSDVPGGSGLTPEAELDAWVLAQPLERHGRSFGNRDARRGNVRLTPLTCGYEDPRSEAANAFVAGCAERVLADGSLGVELVGAQSRLGVLQCLDIAERVRNEAGLLTCVRAPIRFTSDLAAGLVSARTDLVSLTEGQ